MKKLILVLLLIPSLCFAVEPIDWNKTYALGPAFIGGAGGGVAAAGGGLVQSCEDVVDVVNYSDNYYYQCTRFKATKSTTITRVDLNIRNSGDTGNDVVRIMTDKAGPLPDALATGDCTSAAVARTSYGSSYSWNTFSSLSCSVTLDSYYWICKGDGIAYGAEVEWEASPACYSGQTVVYGDSDPPTTVWVGTGGTHYRLYD